MDKFKPFTYRDHRIMMSGRDYIKVMNPQGHKLVPRVKSIEAAKALVLAQGRVMTRKEHALVHNRAMAQVPTQQQAESEARVAAGEVEGFI